MGHKEGPGKLVKRGGKEILWSEVAGEDAHVDRWAELSAEEREAAEANFEARRRRGACTRRAGKAGAGMQRRSRGSVERKTGDEDNSFVQVCGEWQLRRWRRSVVGGARGDASSGESAAAARSRRATSRSCAAVRGVTCRVYV